MSDFLCFEESGNVELSLVGGKAHSLVRLHGGGFSVPNGFIITTHFFDSCSRDTSACLTGTQDLLSEYIERCCSKDRFAVRSSVTVEDSTTHSFAGQFDSFLDVKQPQLVDKIEKCWRSLYNNRVEHYAKSQHNDSHREMAVIVQDMVAAEFSGVAFSVDPVSGDETVIIESVPGSNEALVQGTITPNYCKLDNSLNILEKETAGDGDSTQTNLSEDDTKQVAELVLHVKSFFGHEVDIEWAIENGRIFILQSRPITAIQK